MKDEKPSYVIAYNPNSNHISMYPKWKGSLPNFMSIGEYVPVNPRANLNDYIVDMMLELKILLDQRDINLDTAKLTIKPLDGTKEAIIKEAR